MRHFHKLLKWVTSWIFHWIDTLSLSIDLSWNMMTCVLAPLNGVCRALLILRVALGFMGFSVIGITFLVILLFATIVKIIILIV